MSSLNKITLIGNVGNTPEFKNTTNGFNYVRLSLATSERWTDKTNGEKKEVTTWHNLKFYDPLAQTVASYVKKGSKIYVEGSIKYSEYEKDGVKQRGTEILCRHLVLLGDKVSAPAQENYGVITPSVSFVKQGLETQRPLDELVQFDPKMNPLRNVPKSPFDDLNRSV